jgi:hypothetical protein
MLMFVIRGIVLDSGRMLPQLEQGQPSPMVVDQSAELGEGETSKTKVIAVASGLTDRHATWMWGILAK